MLLRRATAMVAGAALPLATAVALAPVATAQDSPTVTETIEVTYTCTPANVLNIGGTGTWTNQVEVTYPETVSPGEFFDVSIQPGPMQSNTNRLGRITYDIQAPDNVDYRTQALSGQATGLAAGTPALASVNPVTKVTQAGTDVFRIWGGASAQFGTSTGTTVSAGLQKNSAFANPFQLPEVTFSMRAPGTPGEEINFGLPGAGGTASTGAGGGEFAQFQYSRATSATGTGTGGAAVVCAASANAAELTETIVTDAPWVPFEWETDLTLQAQVGTIDEDSLPVNVTASFQRPANDFPEDTMVRLFRDGEAVGDVPMPETGTTVSWQDDIPRGANTEIYRYTAEILESTDALGDTWVGASVASVPVIVNGTGGGTGGGGSLDFGSLDFGSLTNMAEGSLSDSVGYDVAPVSVVLPDLSATLSSGS
ncbi:MAG: hypothetical protein ACK4UY_05700 [Dietzia sp.]